MSWGRVSHPSEVFVIGTKVEVIVLKYDRETGRISLGLKQKTADPWTSVAARFPVETRVRGRVVSLTDYGAFVEIEPGVEGLVHVSEMSWTHEVRHPSRVVSVGDQVETVVLNVDQNSRKISLGMPSGKSTRLNSEWISICPIYSASMPASLAIAPTILAGLTSC